MTATAHDTAIETAYLHAQATECFWEFIRANVSAEDACRECWEYGVDVTPEEMREARMRDRAALGTCANTGKSVPLKQPC